MGQPVVVGIAAGGGPQDRDGIVGVLVPADEEVLRTRVEEDESDEIDRAFGLDTGPDGCRRRFAVGAPRRLRRPGQVEQVGAFGLVELEHRGHRVEDGIGGAAEIAAFEPGVVVHADPGEQCDLLAAQSRDAAFAP